tara:strand:- start:788 stop:907 length:120 start_codon:yes stop_codon:yes gene_type:complete
MSKIFQCFVEQIDTISKFWIDREKRLESEIDRSSRDGII